MRLAFATVVPVLSNLASAQFEGVIIEIRTASNPDVGLSIFGVVGLQTTLQLKTTPEKKFLLTTAFKDGETTTAPPSGWLAGSGTFAYGTKSHSGECRLKGAINEFPKIWNFMGFNIVDPALLASLTGGDRDEAYNHLESCKGLTRSGLELDCDDKTLMCEMVA